jgi:hypothetical protein
MMTSKDENLFIISERKGDKFMRAANTFRF